MVNMVSRQKNSIHVKQEIGRGRLKQGLPMHSPTVQPTLTSAIGVRLLESQGHDCQQH